MLWRMGVWGAGWYDERDVGMIVGGRKPVEESGRRRYCVKPLGVAALTSGFSFASSRRAEERDGGDGTYPVYATRAFR